MAHGRHDQHELTAHMLFSLNQRARRALARSMAHEQHDHFSRMNKMMTAHMLSSEVQRTRKSAAGSISLRQTAAAPAAAPSMARQQRKQSARDADSRKTQASRIREEESSEADGLLLDEAALWSNALIGTTGAKEGWVTLQKGNHKLVTSRLRLGTSARQLHEEQWARRVANDKVELERTEGRKGDDGWRNERPKEREVVRSQNGPIRERAVSLELDTGDPTGFAFGGVFLELFTHTACYVSRIRCHTPLASPGSICYMFDCASRPQPCQVRPSCSKFTRGLHMLFHRFAFRTHE